VATTPAEFFTTGQHRALHGALKLSAAKSGTFEYDVVRDSLMKAGQWSDALDGVPEKISPAYLSDLQDQAPPTVQINAYIRLMKNAYRQRRILQEARKLVDRAGKEFLSDEDLHALEDAWQESAFAISINQADRGALRHVKDVMTETLAGVEARHNRTAAPNGVLTGFWILDKNTGGFRPGELIVICGRPSMGKTSFALDVSVNAVPHVPVAFFSLEMSTEQLGQRLLAKKAAVDLRQIRAGRDLHKHQFDALVDAMGDICDYPLWFDDSSTLSPSQIRFRTRQICVRYKAPIGLVVVDYLQIASPSRKYDSREREISSISREMKQLSKDLNCPVILLSQLNRELEKRSDKRPTLADLRESGAIEQDADVVIGLFQPFPYTNKDEDRGKAEAVILKQRNGPVGSIDLRWTAETATFWNPK
jgi:replicative DNA helicase